MSGLSEAHTNGNFSIEKYQTRYTNKTIAIQVALGIIAVSGITLAVLSHYGCVDHIFTYVGTGGAITSALSAIGIFVFCRKNNLKKAFEEAQSLEEIQQVISITQERPIFSWTNMLGATYDCELFSTHIHGAIRSDDVNKKSLEFSHDKSVKNYLIRIL